MKKLLFIYILTISLASKSVALLEIDITRGNLDPLPIAISPLHVDIKSENYDGVKIKLLGEDISKIIEDNFRSTGLFNPLKKEAFVQKPDIAHLKPRFEDWRLIKAQALVTGKLLIKDGKLKVEFRLWDLAAAKEMFKEVKAGIKFTERMDRDPSNHLGARLASLMMPTKGNA